MLGVEKNNDDSKRNYFSSNRRDATAEILKTEARLETLAGGADTLPKCRSEKRPYHKRDTGYWDEGGIIQSRAAKRPHHHEE